MSSRQDKGFPDFQEVVEAEGHLIDSHIMERIFDAVVEFGGRFEVEQFSIGRTNSEPSKLRLKVEAPSQKQLEQMMTLLLGLGCAAVDSGLPDPQQITAEAVRHSYIAYLVRQGLRLSDLEQVVGYLEPPEMLSYSTYSPPQQGRKIDEIELLHPALIASG